MRWFLPVSATADQPAIRLILGRSAQTNRRQWIIHILMAVVYIPAILIGGQLVMAPAASRTAGMMNSLLGMVIFGQFFTSAGALALTLSVINDQRKHNTWDIVRTTAGGTRQAVRAAWTAAVFYRLSGWLGVLVYAPRFFMLSVLLIDLMGFRGEYLDQIVGGATPSVPWIAGIPLFALMLTTLFLLPLSTLGLEAAIGLFLSTTIRSRFGLSLIQAVLTLARLLWGIVGLMLLNLGENVIIRVDSGQTWQVAVSTLAGDWGFSLLHAAHLEVLWRDIPYMAYFGVGLMGIIFLHLLLTEGLLTWAARRAQRME